MCISMYINRSQRLAEETIFNTAHYLCTFKQRIRFSSIDRRHLDYCAFQTYFFIATIDALSYLFWLMLSKIKFFFFEGN